VDKRDGNVVITGQFQAGATITFGGDVLSQGQTFLAKFSGADGSHLWSKNFGNMADSQGSGVAIDANGNIILVGTFNDAIDFTSSQLSWPFPSTALLCVRTSIGDPTRDFFVAKFSPAGAYQWAKSFGGQSEDAANSVNLDASGNIFVSGSFTWKMTIGGQTLTAWASSSTDRDIFLAKLSPAGDPLWAKSFAGNISESPAGLAVDNSGNVLITGSFSYTLNVGGTMLTSSTQGSPNGFLAKYSNAGSLAWVKRFGGPGNAESYSVSTDTGGNAFVTGTFSGTADFDGQSLTSAGGTDAFLLKLNP